MQLKGGDTVTGFGWFGTIIKDEGEDKTYPLVAELHAELGKDTLPLHYRCTREGKIDIYHKNPSIILYVEKLSE